MRDQAAFKQWLADEEVSARVARAASQKMLRHPWFQAFCRATSVAPEEWGKEDADVATEVALFEEWLSCAEVAAHQAQQGRINNPDLEETQVAAAWTHKSVI